MDFWFSRNNGTIECALHLRLPIVSSVGLFSVCLTFKAILIINKTV